MNLSLLVTVDPALGHVVREKGSKDGLDLVEVTFEDDPKGPFVLGFDSATSLLKRIEWEAVVFGSPKPRQTRIELLDYRKADGLLVAFQARFFVDDQLVSEDRVVEVRVDHGIPDAVFDEPAGTEEVPIRSRRAGQVTVVMIERDEGEEARAAAEAEERLVRYLEKHRLKRNGPLFRLHPLEEGQRPAVAIPIEAPAPETRPTTRPSTGEPRIATIPDRAVLTTVVTGGDPAARSLAIERLLSRARTDGVEPSGPCRVVVWSEHITQLQLPIRPRQESR